MLPEPITSRDNPRFKRWMKWATSARERRKAAMVMLEGIHLLTTWEASGRTLTGNDEVVLLAESAQQVTEVAVWLANHPTVAVCVLADRLFMALAEAETPQGMLAWVAQPVGAEGLQYNRDTVVLDGVQDPGNMGTLIRTAAAAGFQQIILSKDCTSAWSGKALRAAQGAQCLVNIIEQADVLAFLHAFQGQSLATSLNTDQYLHSTRQIRQKGPIAWIFGSEGQGISPEVLDAADLQLKIALSENVESLNVAAAAAVCLFELVRLRNQQT